MNPRLSSLIPPRWRSSSRYNGDDRSYPRQTSGGVPVPSIRCIRRQLQDRGASATEYGLMVAAIAAVIVGVTFGLGTLVKGAFSKTCVKMAVGPASLGDPVADCGADPTPPPPPADPGGGDPVAP